MKYKDNYMIYVGSNYSKYKDLCKEYGLQFYSGWKGNVEYYGMLDGETKAISEEMIEEYHIDTIPLHVFEHELIISENNIDNFSII